MGKDIKWEAKFITNKVNKQTQDALRKCAADLQRKSAEQAPLDTGDLRANCNVSPVRKKKREASIKVGHNFHIELIALSDNPYRPRD